MQLHNTDHLHLETIRKGINNILGHRVNMDADTLKNDIFIRIAIYRELGIIGKATQSLSSEFKCSIFGESNLHLLEGLIVVLHHQSQQINHGVIWRIIENDLPVISASLEGSSKAMVA